MESLSFVDVLQTIGQFAPQVYNNNYTHVTLYDPIKKWVVPQPKIQDFWVGYCEAYDREEHLYVGERNTDVMPVIFDMTFKFDDIPEEEHGEDPYDASLIKYIVAAAQEAIESMFKLSIDRQELACCVLEPDRSWIEGVTDNTYIVTKIRLHFPRCKIETSKFLDLRKLFIKNLRKFNVKGHYFNKEPLGDWATIIDSTTLFKPLVMLGSTPNIMESKLSLTKIYDVITVNEYKIIEEIDDDEIDYELSLSSIFNPGYHGDVRSGLIDDSIFGGAELDRWIPMLFSVNYWLGICSIKEKDSEIVKTKVTDNIVCDTEETRIAFRLMKMLNTKRFQQGLFNREIGKALYDCFRGDESGLNLWLIYTKNALQSSKMDDEVIEKITNKMEVDYYLYYDSKVTLKTLAWYAKEDNAESYEAWHFEWCTEAIDKAVSCLHQDVAEAFYRQNWLDHICVDPSGPKWYKFNGHRMIKDPSGIGLRKKLGREFVKLFDKRRRDLLDQKRALDDNAPEKEKDDIENMIQSVCNLVSCIKTEPFKNSVMSCVKEFFYIEDFNFYEKIDSSMDTVGLPNGVLEVYEDRCYFRKGKPEDYITKKMGVPYREEYNWNTEVVKRYLSWIKMLHRDEELCNEWRKFTASLLQGGNNEKMFPVWTGSGNNGKSMIMKLFHCAFGSYCFDYPVELLTCKNKNPQGPSPATARGKGARLALASEPDDEDPIKKGFIKKISGGDSFYGRMLNEDGGDIIASFVMALVVNDIPVVSRADEAFRKRLWIVPFLSKWVEQASDSKKEQMKTGMFQMDKFFDRKIPELAPAMLWVAVQDFAKYKEEGLSQEIEIVKKATEKYWVESDIYYQYTNEAITFMKDSYGNVDEKRSLSISQVYLNFKKWFSQCFPGSPVPDRRVFTKEISNRWGEPKKSKWFGIIFTESDDADDGDYTSNSKSVYDNFD